MTSDELHANNDCAERQRPTRRSSSTASWHEEGESQGDGEDSGQQQRNDDGARRWKVVVDDEHSNDRSRHWLTPLADAVDPHTVLTLGRIRRNGERPIE